MTTPTHNEVPKEVLARLAAWEGLWRRSAFFHYGIGITGVAASLLAAALPGGWSKAAAVVSGICLSILGFVNPQKRYTKFVSAWRVLDAAVLRYRYGLESFERLLKAYEKGETIISEFEEREQESSLRVAQQALEAVQLRAQREEANRRAGEVAQQAPEAVQLRDLQRG